MKTSTVLLAAAGLGLAAWAYPKKEEPAKDEAPKRTVRIAALGDSITESGGYLAEVQRVLNALEPGPDESKEGINIEIQHLGLKGQGVKAIAAQLPKLMDPPPQLLIIQAGVNDIAAGRSVDAITTELGLLYQSATSALKALSPDAETMVIILPILPWAGYMRGLSSPTTLQRKTEAVNAWILENAPSRDVSALADAGGMRLAPFADAGDGLHLSAAGEKKLGELIAELIAEL